MGIIYVIEFLILVSSFQLMNAQTVYLSATNLSSPWFNSPFLDLDYLDSDDRSILRPILLRSSPGPGFACGFYCNHNCSGYLFSVLIFQNNSDRLNPTLDSPRVVWSANRNYPVKENATLQFTQEGDLVLNDADGTLVWSANTYGMFVSGLNLTETGNLVLFDHNNASVWQSFDHPTDCLVPEQKLAFGQKLIASVSDNNRTQGLVSFSLTNRGLTAYVDSNPPQYYYNSDYVNLTESSPKTTYVRFRNGGLFLYSTRPMEVFPRASSAQYMKLEPKGQLRVYDWVDTGWEMLADVFPNGNDCLYPMVCGKYGICSDTQCSCPNPSGGETSYFKQLDHKQPDLGCSEITPLSCEAFHYHSLLELPGTGYFSVSYNIESMDIESCKRACLKNCSCKAAVFINAYDSVTCYFLSEVFSFMNIEMDLYANSTSFIKVQEADTALKEGTPTPTPIPLSPTNKTRIGVALRFSLGFFFGLMIIIFIIWSFYFWKRKKAEEDEEDCLYQLPGMPTRFSHNILIAATANFRKKIGNGGFGSVFEGTLRNGSKIAVKCLDGFNHVKRSFLAEVETIGSIHHINLVRLVGYCAEKSHRFLVYEYMCNGSLDKWIFRGKQGISLDWKTRKKIILDAAKGLAYLHNDCRQTILHLDIKPSNILLDENFNAKVSDFGLCKLIDRDQTEVVTTMRGTPGYLAPEWLSSVITEKVDVYSFGVVIMEILCGRKNLDLSQPEERMHLLSVFKEKIDMDQLTDMVDKCSEDMQLHGAEGVEMMKVAAWCLQSNIAKRPSMSVVIKALEGLTDVEENLDYNFFNPLSSTTRETNSIKEGGDLTPVRPSVLSGPR